MTKSTFFLFVLALVASARVEAQPLATRVRAYLDRATENGYAGSVLVASKGKIVLEQGCGMADREAKRPQTTETVFSVGSITKQFTAAAIVKLWSQKKLNLTDPLARFFPDAPADKAKITLHQLLTHTAGFPDAIGDDYENVDATQFAAMAFEVPLENPPGTTYQYSNVGYSLLGIIVEKVSGQGYEQFLRSQLWLPAGMKRTGYVLPGFKTGELAVGYRDGERWGTALDHPWLPEGPGWHLRANGGVLSTVGDMYRWYKALKNNTVLSKAATQKLFTPHTAEGPQGLSHYGYGWVVQNEGGKRLIWHNGGNGVYNAYMGFDLAQDFCVIASSNSNNKISDRIARQIRQMADGGGGLLDAAFIKTYSGTYSLPRGGSFEVKIDETNSLIVGADNPEAVQWLAADGTERDEEINEYATRTRNMLDGVRRGDFSLLARYRELPPEAVEQRLKPFWNDVQAERGPITGTDLLGVVARRKAGLTLSIIRVNFERNPLCFMYIWRGEHIEDVQTMPVFEKVFECQNGKDTFFAENTGMTITAQKTDDGRPSLRIRHAKGEVIAIKD